MLWRSTISSSIERKSGPTTVGRRATAVCAGRGARSRRTRALRCGRGLLLRRQVSRWRELGEQRLSDVDELAVVSEHEPDIDSQVIVGQNVSEPAQTRQSFIERISQKPVGVRLGKHLFGSLADLSVARGKDSVQDVEHRFGNEL